MIQFERFTAMGANKKATKKHRSFKTPGSGCVRQHRLPEINLDCEWCRIQSWIHRGSGCFVLLHSVLQRRSEAVIARDST